jgi:hypothetical protein
MVHQLLTSLSTVPLSVILFRLVYFSFFLFIYYYFFLYIVAAGSNVPLGFRFIGARYIFANSTFQNFNGSQGYNGGVVMFVSGYSAQITMQSTNFTNIVVKV